MNSPFKNSHCKNNHSNEQHNNFDNIYNGVYIPDRFRNVILKHLILNYSKNINSFSPALLLQILLERYAYSEIGGTFILI